jgi:hypothetical protein
LPSSPKNEKVLIELVEGNSMGDVDNFTGVLNKITATEAISRIEGLPQCNILEIIFRINCVV